MAVNEKLKVEPFFRDVVDYDKDPGERWVIGTRKTNKKTPPKVGKHIKGAELPPSEKKEEEFETVEVALILRRMPFEIADELTRMYISERTIKDRQGNERESEYWESARLNQFITEKCLWMWLDTENFWAEIGDDDAAQLYLSGYAGGTEEKKPNIKPNDWHKVDGHLNEAIQRHLLDRFSPIRTQILKAAQKYDEEDSHKEKILRGNSQSG